jgi:chloramphenicol O-acetyltransferase type A
MRELIEIENWNRREQFYFFSKFTEPFFGITVKVDCTEAYRKSKERNASFFLYYLYRALKSANLIENFRYRIVEGEVYMYNLVHASPTINRPNGTFGFAYMNYVDDEDQFIKDAALEIENVQNTTNLLPAISGENVIHFSALPWLDFSSISHARSYSHPDSCPKISFGKMTEMNGQKLMSISIHGHHALMDGYHVGKFIEQFEKLLNE